MQQSQSTLQDSATPYTGNNNSDEVVSGGGTCCSDKIPDPPIFYNKPDKDTMEFKEWHRAITNKLRINADRFAGDRARQAYIETCLGGRAAKTLTPYLRNTYPDSINTSAKLLDYL